MARIGYVVGTLLLCLGATPTFAQTIEPPAGPGDRPKPDFEPIGGRIGSFILHPQTDVRVGYDDNVLASDNGGQGDFVAAIRPSITAMTLWQRNRIVLDAYAEQTLHGKLTSEDVLEGGARASWTLDATRKSKVTVTTTFDALAENRSSITNINAARSPVRFRKTALSARFSRDFNTFGVSADVDVSNLDFSDARTRAGTPIDQDYRDSRYYGGSARVSYRVGPGLSVLARANVDRLDYTRGAVGATVFDRDNNGAKLEGGVAVELSRLIFGELRAGYLKRWSEDARVGDSSGLSFGGNLTWNVTPLTTIRFYADRSIEEGGSQQTLGNLRAQAKLSVEHELLRSLVLSAEVDAARINPVGPLPNASEYGGEVAATYYLSRRFRLLGRVQHSQRVAPPPFRNFSKNVFFATIRWVL